MPKGLTIKKLGELAKKYFPNTVSGYRNICPHILDKLDKPAEEPIWLLMTTDVVNGTYEEAQDQEIQVKKLAETSQVPYEIPTTLQAITCILAEYFRSKTRLFSDVPLIYIRCQEKVKCLHVVVGHFAPAGLNVDINIYDIDCVGVAALRKF
jgi:hypothetical protein